MKIKINRYHMGFMGITHIIFTLFLLELMIIFKVPFIKNMMTFPIVILSLMIIIGATLIPDLDSSPLEGGNSTALHQLGVVGSFLSLLFIMISGVISSIVRGKGDREPPSQHRLFWHTPLVPVLIVLFAMFLIPYSKASVLSELLNLNKIIDNFSIVFSIVIIFISLYLGVGYSSYKMLSMFKLNKYRQFVILGISVFSLVFIFINDLMTLKNLMYMVAIGYLFHILGDELTQGACPILFPIPVIKKKKLMFWWKPKPLMKLSIPTNSVIEIGFRIVLLLMDIAMFIYIVSVNYNINIIGGIK